MSSRVFADAGDGKLRFVGDFEALYKEEADPWEQAAETGDMADYYAFSRARLADALRHYFVRSGLEIGCGHGHLAAHLKRSRAIPRMVGTDISPAAIATAKERYPACEFIVGDIMARDFVAPRPVEFVVWGQMLWYVLHEIDRAVINTLRCVVPGGIFIVSQAFLKEQRYGREVVNGFEGAIERFRRYEHLRLIECRYDDTDKHVHNDGLLVFRVL